MPIQITGLCALALAREKGRSYSPHHVETVSTLWANADVRLLPQAAAAVRRLSPNATHGRLALGE